MPKFKRKKEKMKNATATATQIMQAIKTAEGTARLYNLPSEFINESDIAEMLETATETSDLISSLTDYFENSQGLLDVEIIYYATAINYLKENDCSLTDSLSLAAEYGYELKNLNSEILASILASEQNRESFYGEFLKELETEIDSLEIDFEAEGTENE